MDRNRLVLIGGGVRSGKSRFAVELGIRLGERRAFIATARPSDSEMLLRIERHRNDRCEAFTTVEEPLRLAETLQSLEGFDVVVVDCLTLWLSNLLLQKHPTDMILGEVDRLVDALGDRRCHVVLVTNEVGMSVHPPTALGRAFVEVCGLAHQRLARAADDVYLAVLGTVLRIRPRIEAITPPGGEASQ